MDIEKQASPASRRIMALLRSKNVEQRQAIADRLAEYSADLRSKSARVGFYSDSSLPVPRAIIDKLKSSPELAARIKDLSDYRKIHDSTSNKDLYTLRNRYDMMLKYHERIGDTVAPPRPPVRKDSLNENAIVTALRGRLSTYDTPAPDTTEVRKKIMRAFKEKIQETKTPKLLAQFPKEQPGVGEMYFTPHLFEADLNKRKDYMRSYTPRRAGVPGYNEDRLYETVLNRQNVTDPSKRLVGGKYYIPAEEGVLPSTLPNADSGYIYKGGDPRHIRQAKNLKRLSGDENAFFSGLPTVSARYATNIPRAVAKVKGIDPADMPVQPAGYKELRRYLYGDPAKRTEAINSSLTQHSKYFDPIDVRQPEKSFLEAFGIDKGVENNVTPKVPMLRGLKKVTPMLSGLKQQGASMVGKARGFLGGKFGLGKATA
jgi:hypothetical protein